MICTYCKSPAILSCPCAKVSYCGKECQGSDWKRYKPDCPPFIVKEVPGKGRGLIATRTLPFGFKLLTEQPVLAIDPTKKLEKSVSVFLCISVSITREKKTFVFNTQSIIWIFVCFETR